MPCRSCLLGLPTSTPKHPMGRDCYIESPRASHFSLGGKTRQRNHAILFFLLVPLFKDEVKFQFSFSSWVPSENYYSGSVTCCFKYTEVLLHNSISILRNIYNFLYNQNGGLCVSFATFVFRMFVADHDNLLLVRFVLSHLSIRCICLERQWPTRHCSICPTRSIGETVNPASLRRLTWLTTSGRCSRNLTSTCSNL